MVCFYPQIACTCLHRVISDGEFDWLPRLDLIFVTTCCDTTIWEAITA